MGLLAVGLIYWPVGLLVMMAFTLFAQFSVNLNEPPKSEQFLTHYRALMLQCLCLSVHSSVSCFDLKEPYPIFARVILFKITQILTPMEFLKDVYN